MHKNKINSVPIWVKVDLPKQLWTKNGIDFISSILGETICMDEATSKRERLNYARICVVIDLELKFPSFIPVDMGKENKVDIGLEYDWIPAKCSICKTFGHSDDRCQMNKEAQQPQHAAQPVRPQRQNKNKQKQHWALKQTPQQGQTSVSSVEASHDQQAKNIGTAPADHPSAPINREEVSVEASHDQQAGNLGTAPTDHPSICTQEINRGDGDCEVAPIVVADSQQHVEVQVEQHENEPPHQEVALIHMNSEICSVDLDVVVQVDSATIHVDVAIGTNDSQNLLISEQSCIPIEQQTRYKAQPISPHGTRSRVQRETRADEEWTTVKSKRTSKKPSPCVVGQGALSW
ncbi:hypothetical protein IFM89_037415 [Coptis chinensis]|uniref:DUF4283 domain-containing protein n=1 Tax=Coptis chinensis TaxID=261450 RepID=A0A835J1N1_9MAGN|nr:hypothetical protein IFM89_037415 [Coptis chinensis]